MCEHQQDPVCNHRLPRSGAASDNWPQVEAASRAVLPPEIGEYIDACREKPHPESHLIAILHRVQGHFGYLGKEPMDAVAQLLRVPVAKVTGVATFYHFFRLTPRGKFIINICMGTACYVRGAEKVAARFKEELGIEFGQTTTDGQFSLEQSRCLGTCGLAPVLMINGKVHAKVTADQVSALLEKCTQAAAHP